MAIRYWLAVVQREHVLRAVELGIVQANHGSRAPIAAMNESDGVVFYSPRERIGGEPLKEFTAIGRVHDDQIAQVDDGGFRPWRRRVDFDRDRVATAIRPLVKSLDFTRDATNWGYQLRRGMIEISRHDFDLIRKQMSPSAPDGHSR
jgi:hypothetical protein